MGACRVSRFPSSRIGKRPKKAVTSGLMSQCLSGDDGRDLLQARLVINVSLKCDYFYCFCGKIE